MRISPFTPLFFIDRQTDGRESPYVQTFAITDEILIEIFVTNDSSPAQMEFVAGNVLSCGTELFGIPFRSWAINEDVTLYFATLRLDEGEYTVWLNGIGESEPFRVTANKNELAKTTLIQYSMSNNRQRMDAVFFIDGMQYFFDFRVPGGFKDGGWTFSVDNEQFVTPLADIAQLWGMESTQQRFTMGTGMGVPVWFGEMLNRILVCSHVYFDGVKYCRKETSVPEMTQTIDGVNSFIFNQSLQKSVNLDPRIETSNHVIMRRVDDGYRTVSNNRNRIIR